MAAYQEPRADLLRVNRKVAARIRETARNLRRCGARSRKALLPPGRKVGAHELTPRKRDAEQLLHVAPYPVLAIPPMKQTVASEAPERVLVGAVQ